jgi:predicted transcriptional regulator
MKETKNISFRLTSEEYTAFDTICREKGYSKTGKIREFIRKLIKDELTSAKISAEEWKKIEDGIEEIEKGEYVTLEEFKRDLETSKVANNKDSQYRTKKHKSPRS